MNSRKPSIDCLEVDALEKKIKDITLCLFSAKDPEATEKFTNQLRYARDRQAILLQLKLNFHEPSPEEE